MTTETLATPHGADENNNPLDENNQDYNEHYSAAGATTDEEDLVERLLSERLLEGFLLLEKACPACSTPLVKEPLDDDQQRPPSTLPGGDGGGKLTKKDAALIRMINSQESNLSETTKSAHPIQGIPFCVSCKAHVITDESEVKFLDQTDVAKLTGSILVDLAGAPSPQASQYDNTTIASMPSYTQKPPLGSKFFSCGNSTTRESIIPTPEPVSFIQVNQKDNNNDANSKRSTMSPAGFEVIPVAKGTNEVVTGMQRLTVNTAPSTETLKTTKDRSASDEEPGMDATSKGTHKTTDDRSARYEEPGGDATSKTTHKTTTDRSASDEEPGMDATSKGTHKTTGDRSASDEERGGDTTSTAALAGQSFSVVDTNCAVLTDASVKFGAKAKASPILEKSSTTETDSSNEAGEALPEYSVRRDIATKVLGAKMLLGHSLTEKQCKKCSMPLMEFESQIECFVCPALEKTAKQEKRKVEKNQFESDNRTQTTATPTPSTASKLSATPSTASLEGIRTIRRTPRSTPRHTPIPSALYSTNMSVATPQDCFNAAAQHAMHNMYSLQAESIAPPSPQKRDELEAEESRLLVEVQKAEEFKEVHATTVKAHKEKENELVEAIRRENQRVFDETKRLEELERRRLTAMSIPVKGMLGDLNLQEQRKMMEEESKLRKEIDSALLARDEAELEARRLADEKRAMGEATLLMALEEEAAKREQAAEEALANARAAQDQVAAARRDILSKTIANGTAEAVAEAESTTRAEREDYHEKIVLPTSEELRKERWETLRAESRSVMTRRIMKGWTLLPEFCRGTECESSPLLCKFDKKMCVVCGGCGSGMDGAYKLPDDSDDEDGDGEEHGDEMNYEDNTTVATTVARPPMEISTFREKAPAPVLLPPAPAALPATLRAPAPVEDEEMTGPPSPTKTRSTAQLQEDFDTKRNMVSKEIGKRMLKGWTLLDMSCPNCVMPLMTDPGGKDEHCVLCGLVGQLTSSNMEIQNRKLEAEPKVFEESTSADERSDSQSCAEETIEHLAFPGDESLDSFGVKMKDRYLSVNASESLVSARERSFTQEKVSVSQPTTPPKVDDGDENNISQQVDDGDEGITSHRVDDGDENNISQQVDDGDEGITSHRVDDGDENNISQQVDDGDEGITSHRVDDGDENNSSQQVDDGDEDTISYLSHASHSPSTICSISNQSVDMIRSSINRRREHPSPRGDPPALQGYALRRSTGVDAEESRMDRVEEVEKEAEDSQKEKNVKISTKDKRDKDLEKKIELYISSDESNKSKSKTKSVMVELPKNFGKGDDESRDAPLAVETKATAKGNVMRLPSPGMTEVSVPRAFASPASSRMFTSSSENSGEQSTGRPTSRPRVAPESLRSRSNTRTLRKPEPAGGSDRPPVTSRSKLPPTSSKPSSHHVINKTKDQPEIIVIGAPYDKMSKPSPSVSSSGGDSIGSSSLDALLTRIDETKAQLELDPDTTSQVDKQTRLRLLINNLAAAAAAVQELE